MLSKDSKDLKSKWEIIEKSYFDKIIRDYASSNDELLKSRMKIKNLE